MNTQEHSKPKTKIAFVYLNGKELACKSMTNDSKYTQKQAKQKK